MSKMSKLVDTIEQELEILKNQEMGQEEIDQHVSALKDAYKDLCEAFIEGSASGKKSPDGKPVFDYKVGRNESYTVTAEVDTEKGEEISLATVNGSIDINLPAVKIVDVLTMEGKAAHPEKLPDSLISPDCNAMKFRYSVQNALRNTHTVSRDLEKMCESAKVFVIETAPTMAENAKNYAVEFVKNDIAQTREDIHKAGEHLKNGAIQTGKNIKAGVQAVADGYNALNEGAREVNTVIAESFAWAHECVKEAVEEHKNQLIENVKLLGNKIKDGGEKIAHTIKDTSEKAAYLVEKGAAHVQSDFQKLGDAIQIAGASLDVAKMQIHESVKKAFEATRESLSKGAEATKGFFQKVGGGIKSGAEKLFHAGKSTAEAFAERASEIVEKGLGKTSELATTISHDIAAIKRDVLQTCIQKVSVENVNMPNGETKPCVKLSESTMNAISNELAFQRKVPSVYIPIQGGEVYFAAAFSDASAKRKNEDLGKLLVEAVGGGKMGEKIDLMRSGHDIMTDTEKSLVSACQQAIMAKLAVQTHVVECFGTAGNKKLYEALKPFSTDKIAAVMKDAIINYDASFTSSMKDGGEVHTFALQMGDSVQKMAAIIQAMESNNCRISDFFKATGMKIEDINKYDMEVLVNTTNNGRQNIPIKENGKLPNGETITKSIPFKSDAENLIGNAIAMNVNNADIPTHSQEATVFAPKTATEEKTPESVTEKTSEPVAVKTQTEKPRTEIKDNDLVMSM